MRRAIRVAALAALSILLGTTNADNLADVYQQALVNDPTFKKAEADWLTAKENLPLSWTGNGGAGSGLFPNIDFSTTVGRTYIYGGNSQATQYQVTLTQPIFNLSTWESISAAGYAVKAATAQYLAAGQALISRVANAYLEVLRANEALTVTHAKQKQFKHEYVTAQAKYEVGLIAVTGVYDAKAKYDDSVAQLIKEKNDLQNRLEDLSAITGKNYESITVLKSAIPLVVPQPKNIDEWTTIANKQNYELQANLNSMLASRQNIKAAATGNMPTLNLVGAYSNGTINEVTNLPAGSVGPIPEQTQVGLQLNFPVLRGGYDIVNTKQARYKYLAASDQMAISYRKVKSQTRQAYLGVKSGISQIKADKQAIESAKQQLRATQEGYTVGTRTMVDVLDSVTALSTAQLQYANDRYNYVESIFNLKQQAGTLSPNDIQDINGWLDGTAKVAEIE